MSVVVKKKGKGYARIFALGDERVAVLNNLLATGGSTVQAARLIQQDWKEFQDVAEKSLIQQVNRYRMDYIDSPAVAQQLGLGLSAPKTQIVLQKMDVLNEFYQLAELQKERLNLFLTKEKEIKMPFGGTNKEVETLSTILKDIQKMQFDLGVEVYKGPLIQGGRATQTNTLFPDGTMQQTRVLEAVSTAMGVMDQFGTPSVKEDTSNVVAG